MHSTMDKICHRVSQGNFRTPGYKKEKIPPKLLERENSSLNRGIENQTALDFSAAKLKYRERWDYRAMPLKFSVKIVFTLEFLPHQFVIQTWELNIYLQMVKMFISHALFL